MTDVRIIPILFSSRMVCALLDDRKVVTRRTVSPQPSAQLCYIMAGSSCGKWGYPSEGCANVWGEPFHVPPDLSEAALARLWTPPCHANDVLWVRETWSEDDGQFMYRADYLNAEDLAKATMIRWHPSIHMPRKAARIFLRVANVSVERLHDIPDADLVSEGVNVVHPLAKRREEFAALWNSTVKRPAAVSRYGWDANPWGWRIAFARCEKPEGFDG